MNDFHTLAQIVDPIVNTDGRVEKSSHTAASLGGRHLSEESHEQVGVIQ
jgi:hypothetical protein